MPDAASHSLTYYPSFCWRAAPTYNVWVKLSAADVHALKHRPGHEGQRVFFCKNHPIRFVRLVGLVTSFDNATETTLRQGSDGPTKTVRTPWTFTLDDGSGENINVVCWKDESEARLATRPGEKIELRFADLHKKPGRTAEGKDVSLDGVELGKVVKVKGWVDEFKGRRQILLERVWILDDTAAEVQAWSELAEFQRAVLSKPWILSREQVEKLRNKDERSRRETTGAKRERRAVRGAASDVPEKAYRIWTVPPKGKKHLHQLDLYQGRSSEG